MKAYLGHPIRWVPIALLDGDWSIVTAIRRTPLPKVHLSSPLWVRATKGKLTSLEGSKESQIHSIEPHTGDPSGMGLFHKVTSVKPWGLSSQQIHLFSVFDHGCGRVIYGIHAISWLLRCWWFREWFIVCYIMRELEVLVYCTDRLSIPNCGSEPFVLIFIYARIRL